MKPLKPQQQNGRIIELIQWMGLIILICFIYKHFGPEASSPITPAAIIFGTAVFLLLGRIQLNFKD